MAKVAKGEREKIWRKAVVAGPQAVGALLDSGADPNERLRADIVPLQLALRETRGSLPEILRLLLERGADVRTESANRNTPLHFAAWNLSPEAVELFIAAGADARAANARGENALHQLAGSAKLDLEGDCHPRIVDLLANAGTDPMAFDDTGALAIHHLPNLHSNCVALRRRIVALYSDVDVRTKNGWTTLACCPVGIVNNEFRAALQAMLLVEAGADLNVRVSGEPFVLEEPSATRMDRATPLHVSIARARHMIAEVLLDAGADPAAKDGAGATAVDLAAASPGAWHTVPLLKREKPAEAATIVRRMIAEAPSCEP